MNSQERAKKEIDEIIEIIAETTPKVEKTWKEYVSAIIALAIASGATSKFTFASNKTLDDTVNKKLVELSDEIKRILDGYIRNATNVVINISPEDVDAAIEYVNRTYDDKNIVDRLDSYHSELKYIIEAYIAAGVAEGLSAIEIMQEYISYKDKPLTSPTIRKAMTHNIDFKTPLILSMGFSLGIGHYSSTLANYKRLSAYSIAEAYNYGSLLTMRRDSKVAGYRTFRNSSYDCAICDELTKYVHPLTSLVVPAHPRCVCGIYPVSRNDVISESRQKFNAYSKEWEQTFFDNKTGGYVVTSKQRIQHAQKSKNELSKFKKEQKMCLTLSQSGHIIEHLSEKPGISSPDITIDGVNADLKKLSSANNIARHAKKAIKKQGAQLVIFEFEKIDSDILQEIRNLTSCNIHGYYFDSKKIIRHF